jgi:hypothetical protein
MPWVSRTAVFALAIQLCRRTVSLPFTIPSGSIASGPIALLIVAGARVRVHCVVESLDWGVEFRPARSSSS